MGEYLAPVRANAVTSNTSLIFIPRLSLQGIAFAAERACSCMWARKRNDGISDPFLSPIRSYSTCLPSAFLSFSIRCFQHPAEFGRCLLLDFIYEFLKSWNTNFPVPRGADGITAMLTDVKGWRLRYSLTFTMKERSSHLTWLVFKASKSSLNWLKH